VKCLAPPRDIASLKQTKEHQFLQGGTIMEVAIGTHTTILLLFWNMSGTTRVSRYQKGKTRKVKTNLDLLEQQIVGGSGICWAICKSAPHPRQPRQHPTTQFFTGWMPFLPPNQQCQSTEGNFLFINSHGSVCFHCSQVVF